MRAKLRGISILAVIALAGLLGGGCNLASKRDDPRATQSLSKRKRHALTHRNIDLHDSVREGGIPIMPKAGYRSPPKLFSGGGRRPWQGSDRPALKDVDAYDDVTPASGADAASFRRVLGGNTEDTSHAGCQCPGSCRTLRDDQGSFTDGSLPPCLKAGVPGFFDNKDTCW
jgi:hypothetical protein